MSDHIYYELHHEIVGDWYDLRTDVFEKLKLDIQKNGQRVPCVVWAGDLQDDSTWRLVDGRHRQKACQELGIQCAYQVQQFKSFEEAYGIALGMNHMRRRKVKLDQGAKIVKG